MKNTVSVKELRNFLVTVKDQTGKVVAKRVVSSKYALKKAVANFEHVYGDGFTVEKKAA